jgi:hypothetical protein
MAQAEARARATRRAGRATSSDAPRREGGEPGQRVARAARHQAFARRPTVFDEERHRVAQALLQRRLMAARRQRGDRGHQRSRRHRIGAARRQLDAVSERPPGGLGMAEQVGGDLEERQRQRQPLTRRQGEVVGQRQAELDTDRGARRRRGARLVVEMSGDVGPDQVLLQPMRTLARREARVGGRGGEAAVERERRRAARRHLEGEHEPIRRGGDERRRQVGERELALAVASRQPQARGQGLGMRRDGHCASHRSRRRAHRQCALATALAFVFAGALPSSSAFERSPRMILKSRSASI